MDTLTFKHPSKTFVVGVTVVCYQPWNLYHYRDKDIPPHFYVRLGSGYYKENKKYDQRTVALRLRLAFSNRSISLAEFLKFAVVVFI